MYRFDKNNPAGMKKESAIKKINGSLIFTAKVWIMELHIWIPLSDQNSITNPILGKMEPLDCGKITGTADNLLFGACGFE